MAATESLPGMPTSSRYTPYGWNANGSSLYATFEENDDLILAEINIESEELRIVANLGPEVVFGAWLGGPSFHLSLAPDGKSFTCSVSRSASELWMLEEFDLPMSH